MLLLLALIALSLVWLWAGYELCHARHTQRGIGVDPWDYIIPDDPGPIIESWVIREEQDA